MDETPETPPTTKRCSRCERVRELNEKLWGRDKSNADGWRKWCRECVNRAQRERVARNVAKHAAAEAARMKSPNLAAFDAGTFDEDAPILGENLPTPVVPDGFEVVNVTSEVDAEGNTLKQHIGTRIERSVETPILAAVPHGHYIKRMSTLVDGAGRVIQQWQITDTVKEQQTNMLLDAIARLSEQWPSRATPVPAPEITLDSDLMCIYPMGDPHFGMYAWAAETGDDYDLELAAQYHMVAMDSLVASAPNAEDALIVNLGDFFHMDNSSNQTLRSHHQLDVDTRWPKVIRHGLQSMVWLIRRSLEKHKRTHVWNVRGNHDDHSAMMLQLALEQYFKDEPRVTIDTSPAAHYYRTFGRNLVGATHGHTSKLYPLGEQMAADRKEDWGVTDHRYWYVGHVHHDSLLETRGGVIIETMRTLAGKDKYAADAGYRAGRDMKCDVLHKLDGRIIRNTIGIRQIMRRMKSGSSPVLATA